MKLHLTLILALLSFSCTEQKTSVKEKFSIQEISTELGDKYDDIVSDLKARYVSNSDSRSSNDMRSPLRRFMSEIDKYKLSTLSYYRFDHEKFYEDPSEENLQSCMVPLDKLNIIAERNGEVEWRLVVEKKDNFWTIDRLTNQYGRAISWLCDSLYNAGTKHCKIFVYGSTREFVTYDRHGKSLYFRITGEPISGGHLCEFFVEQYNAGLEQKKYIEEHPELFHAPISTTERTE